MHAGKGRNSSFLKGIFFYFQGFHDIGSYKKFFNGKSKTTNFFLQLRCFLEDNFCLEVHKKY